MNEGMNECMNKLIHFNTSSWWTLILKQQALHIDLPIIESQPMNQSVFWDEAVKVLMLQD